MALSVHVSRASFISIRQSGWGHRQPCWAQNKPIGDLRRNVMSPNLVWIVNLKKEIFLTGLQALDPPPPQLRVHACISTLWVKINQNKIYFLQ